jgi:hypothetical protein
MTPADDFKRFFSNVTVRTIHVLACVMASSHEIEVLHCAGPTGGGGFQGWIHHRERATPKTVILESVGAGGLAIESMPMDAATMCP